MLQILFFLWGGAVSQIGSFNDVILMPQLIKKNFVISDAMTSVTYFLSQNGCLLTWSVHSSSFMFKLCMHFKLCKSLFNPFLLGFLGAPQNWGGSENPPSKYLEPQMLWPWNLAHISSVMEGTKWWSKKFQHGCHFLLTSSKNFKVSYFCQKTQCFQKSLCRRTIKNNCTLFWFFESIYLAI